MLSSDTSDASLTKVKVGLPWQERREVLSPTKSTPLCLSAFLSANSLNKLCFPSQYDRSDLLDSGEGLTTRGTRRW